MAREKSMMSLVAALGLMLLMALATLFYWIRRCPQEWAEFGPRRFKRWCTFWTVRRIVCWIGIPLFLWALTAALSHRKELTAIYAHIWCGRSCPALPAEELRFKVVKSYLHFLLSERKSASDGWGHDRLVLLPIHLNAERLIQGISDSTLLKTLTKNALPLEKHEEIDALPPSILSTHPTIAAYSLSYRTAAVTPMQHIQPIHLKDIAPSLNPHWYLARHIGRWEQMQGYGAHFFQITDYENVDLSCCIERSFEKREEIEKRKRTSFDDIQSTKIRILAVSERGSILLRDAMGESSGDTYFIFSVPKKPDQCKPPSRPTEGMRFGANPGVTH